MFSAIASTADIIRRHDYDVTNQPPSLAFIWQDEKSAPVHRHLHLRPSTRRVTADRHLASNALDVAIGVFANLARTDWLGLQRVYDWVLALPLSILCVTSRTSARTGTSLIRVGAPAVSQIHCYGISN